MVLNGKNTAYPFRGHLFLNNHNGGEKAQPIKLCRVMRGNGSHGVKFLSYPGSGRREIEEVKRNLVETL